MRAKAIELICAETGCDSIDETTLIEALGIDSLEFLALVKELDRQIGHIEFDAAVNAQTVGELIGAIAA